MAAKQPTVPKTVKKPRIQLIRAADVKPARLEYLWNGRFPKGTLTLVGGKPGEGKSLMMYLLAAYVSKNLGQAVIMSSPEENVASMKVPRLVSAEADNTRVHLWPNRLRLPGDVEELEMLVRLHNVGLITFDPVAKHLVGTKDPYTGLEPLLAMAERTGVALVGVHHTIKRVPKDDHPRDAFGGGSGGWLGTCREAHLLGRANGGDDGSRYLACVKNNNGDDGGPACEFYMDEMQVDIPGDTVAETARLVLVNEAVMVEANSIVHFKGAGTGPDGDVSSEKKAVAMEFLTLLLAPAGPTPSQEIEKQGKAMGVSARTLRRAGDELGVIKERQGFGPGSFVTWRLPDGHPALRMVESARAAQPPKADVDGAINQILGVIEMEMQVPDVIGEIIGWRAWKVIGDRPTVFPMLASVTHGQTIWHPGYWTEAHCDGKSECESSYDGRVPGESCTCGMYCARTRHQLIGLRYGRPMKTPGREGKLFPKVVGEVGLVGKVIPGTQGWRGEKARVVRLYVPFEHWRLVDPLERLYRVEVVLDNTQKLTQTKFGEGVDR